MSDLTRLTLVEARAGLAAKRFSATELTTAFLEAIAASNKSHASVLRRNKVACLALSKER